MAYTMASTPSSCKSMPHSHISPATPTSAAVCRTLEPLIEGANASAATWNATISDLVRGNGPVRHWRSLARRFVQGGPMRISVLRGSVAAGTHCVDAPNQPSLRNCSWSSRLAALLSHAFPAAHGSYSNLARGGTTVLTALGTIRSLVCLRDNATAQVSPPDIIVLDFAVNDVHEAKHWYACL
jgi:hypothetical protein|eukprot:809927-Prymnesium_polylepis.1